MEGLLDGNRRQCVWRYEVVEFIARFKGLFCILQAMSKEVGMMGALLYEH